MKGSTYKRCSCPVRRNAKGQRLSCKIQHGSWVYVVDAGTVDGRRHQVKRGGYASEAAAETALHETIDQMGKGIATHDDRQTVAAYLSGWLANRAVKGLRAQNVDQLQGPYRANLAAADRLSAVAEAQPGAYRSGTSGHVRIGQSGERAAHPCDVAFRAQHCGAPAGDQLQPGQRGGATQGPKRPRCTRGNRRNWARSWTPLPTMS